MAALVLLLSPSSATAQTAGCLGGCANNNTVLGTSAGYSATGSGSIYLGYASGYNDTGSNDFFVNNVQQSSLANDKAYSLIYGNFSGTAGSLTGQQLVINGNVGIGTTSPSGLLSLGPTLANNKFLVFDAGFSSGSADGITQQANEMRYFGDYGGGYNTNMTFGFLNTSGVFQERMRLTGTGAIGIGTTSPQAPLHVAGGVIIGTDTATCTSAKTGEVHYNATTTYMEYCNGSAWNPFEQPQCSTGSTAACWLPVTRSSGDSNFTAANIVSGTTILGITGTYTPCAVTVPNPEFTNQTGAALSTLTPSNIISIITNSCGAVASISGAAGAQYRICSNASCSTVVQAYSSSSGTVSNGQYVQMEMTSSSSQNTQTTATLTLSATNMPWSITTLTYQGPGDVVSGATAWWGLRAYNAAYAASGGNAITIRRASDNTTQTIAVLSSGDLNVSAASTFCASTTCYVTEAYDQTGNGNNQTQATAAKQPQLVFNCTGSLPCMKFTSSSSQYLSSTLTINQPLTISTVALNSSGATGQIMAGSNGNCSLEWNAAYITIYGGSSPTVNSAAISTSTFYAIQGIINGSSSVNYVDGTAVTGTLSTSGLATIVGLGAYGSGTNPMSGDITEAGVWGSAFNSTQQSSMNSNQRGYWGI